LMFIISIIRLFTAPKVSGVATERTSQQQRYCLAKLKNCD
jgi:hypothetical protein